MGADEAHSATKTTWGAPQHTRAVVVFFFFYVCLSTTAAVESDCVWHPVAIPAGDGDDGCGMHSAWAAGTFSGRRPCVRSGLLLTSGSSPRVPRADVSGLGVRRQALQLLVLQSCRHRGILPLRERTTHKLSSCGHHCEHPHGHPSQNAFDGASASALVAAPPPLQGPPPPVSLPLLAAGCPVKPHEASVASSRYAGPRATD